jgi:hypothetical protein
MTSDLEAEFAGRGVLSGQTLLHDAETALELIREAHRRQVRVLGVDSFIIDGEAMHVLLEHIADYSASDSPWDAAASFVEGRADSGFMFELVLDD